MAGTKISDATLRSTLKGTESIPLVDTDLPKGRTTAANLKTYCAPDLSGYAKKTEIPSLDGYMKTTDADAKYQSKGNYALKSEIPDVSGLATKQEVQGKLDTSTYTSDKATFATKTELGTKLDTSTYNSDKESFATKTELSAKVGGTGVTAIKVVSALPDPQEEGVLYIVTGEEA